MTFDERVHAVAKKGFTERQARFLTTVMLHAGVCVPRQYARFCGIVHGAEDEEVLRQARAAPLRLDVRLPSQPRAHLPRQPAGALRGHRRGGQPLRRPLTLNHAIQRLMVLDAIVEDPDLRLARDRRGEGRAPDGADPDRRRRTCLTSPSARATRGPPGTSRTACRSASTSPAAASSSTSFSTRH